MIVIARMILDASRAKASKEKARSRRHWSPWRCRDVAVEWVLWGACAFFAVSLSVLVSGGGRFGCWVDCGLNFIAVGLVLMRGTRVWL